MKIISVTTIFLFQLVTRHWLWQILDAPVTQDCARRCTASAAPVNACRWSNDLHLWSGVNHTELQLKRRRLLDDHPRIYQAYHTTDRRDIRTTGLMTVAINARFIGNWVL